MPATKFVPKKSAKLVVKPKAVKKQAPKKPAPPKATPRAKLPTKKELEADKARLAKREIAKQKPPPGALDIPGVEFIPALPDNFDRSKRVRSQLEHMWDLEPETVLEGRPRTLGQAVARALYCQALRGDTRAIFGIRDTLGEMPTQKVDQRNTFVDANGNPITGIEIALIDNKPRTSREYNIPQDTSGVNYGDDQRSDEGGDPVAEPEA